MREASVTAFLVALSGVIWPFFLGAGAAHLLGLPWSSACFLGGALTATSVSISARTLMDAGKMTTPEASVILGAAVIDDVMGLFVLAFLAASCSTSGAERLRRGAHALLLAGCSSMFLGGRHPLVVQMTLIAVCVARILFRRLRRGAALGRSSDAPLPQARRQRSGHQLRACAGAALRRQRRVAGQRRRHHRRLSAGIRLCRRKAEDADRAHLCRHRPRASHSALLRLHRLVEQLSRTGRPLAAAGRHLSRRRGQQALRLRHGRAWNGHGTGAQLSRSAAA